MPAWRAFTTRRVITFVALGLCMVPALYLAALWLTLPDVSGLARARPLQTSFMRLRAAETVGTSSGTQVDWVPLGEISPFLVCSVVKAEDGSYFRHGGVEWHQVGRALWKTVTEGEEMGASTITQQVARNLFLGPERSLHRKLREAFIARRLERELGKDQILSIYLNVIEWGDGVWGVEAASRRYLGRRPADIGPFEAAFLAGLIAAPRHAVEGANRQRVQRVQRRVLNQLYGSGMLSEAEWREATARTYSLHEMLASGVPLEQALRRPDPLPGRRLRIPPRPDDTPLPPSRALREECGLQREMDNHRALQWPRP